MQSGKIVWLEWYRLVFERGKYDKSLERYTIDEWVTRKLQDKEVGPQQQASGANTIVTTSGSGFTISAGDTFTVTACTAFDPAQYQLWQQPKP
jgi:hypothetical protein